MTTTRQAAASARQERSVYPSRAARPSQRRSGEQTDAPAAVRVTLTPDSLRADTGTDGEVHVGGLASVTEHGYEMWDWAGPYTEIIDRDAFDKTLSENPLVEFTLNHGAGGGIPMAHTRNGTLVLTVVKDGDETGLEYDAHVDDSRTDVADMVKALRRGDLAEASFKFRITKGQWSPDYTEYRILEVDLHRGDVSAVNFGANPAATSALRDAPVLEEPAKRAVRIDDDDVALRTIPGL